MLFFINLSDTSGTTGDTLYCYPACDWMAGLAGTYPYQEPQGHSVPKVTDYEPDYTNAYGINSSYNNDYLKVFIRTTKSGNAKITIFDIQGNELMTKASALGNGTNNILIDINSLNSGVYVYSIEIDGLKTKTDKITIVK